MRCPFALLALVPLALPPSGCNDAPPVSDGDGTTAGSSSGTGSTTAGTTTNASVDSTTGAEETTSGTTGSSTTGDTTETTETTAAPEDSSGSSSESGGTTTDDTTSGSSSETDATTGGMLPPDAPVLDLTFSQVKQFDFGWAPAAGADYYQLLESATTGDPFVQLGSDLVGSSVSITQPLHFRLQASYVLRACNMSGCTDSATLSVMDSLYQAVGYFKASNTDAMDVFGTSVALSDDGTTLAVGATGESSNTTGIDGDQVNDSITNAGAVYVFVRDASDAWAQQTYIKASNSNANDAFGTSVALSADGNTLVVGAPYEASAATGIGGNQASNTAPASGAAYVFVRPAGTDNWSQQAYVKASNTGFGDIFGYRVALSDDGDTLAVAAYGEGSNATGVGGNQANNAAFGAGAVYVLVRDAADAWSQQAYVKASNTASGDGFGSGLSLSADGSTLAVGAFGEDSLATGIGGDQADNGASQAGATYVFVRDGAGAWSQQAYVKASNTDAQDFFGWSVALSGAGDTLVVGAYGEDGGAIGIGGDETDDSVADSGAVYVLVRDGAGAWSQQAYVKASNTDTQDFFGWYVATTGDGNVLAATAYGEASNAFGLGGNEADDSAMQAGAAYVLVRDGASAWSQRAYVKAPNPAATDTFGWSIAASGDGSIVAVGATSEDGNGTGLGGNQGNNAAASSGAVYLY